MRFLEGRQLLEKKLNQIQDKAGVFTKLPKTKQSKLVDLPVIGPKTIELAYKANLKAIAINCKYTIIYNKKKILDLLKVYRISLINIS